MSSGIYIATSGAIAQDAALDVTANNLANASTTGYQGERVAFKEALAAAKAPDSKFVGVAPSTVDQTAGNLRQTGNPLDVAIRGDGYLAVNPPGGVRYTRDGALTLDAEGTLVTSEGHALLGDNGQPITTPAGAKDISIDDGGHVMADGVEAGRLGLHKIPREAIQRQGDRLFSSSVPPTPAEDSTLVGGSLEQSNVNMIRGVVDLVKISRNYESLMRVIQTYRDVDSSAARQLGKAR